MRVRESNNVLELGNKRIVLGCLTEIKLRQTSSNIVKQFSLVSVHNVDFEHAGLVCFTPVTGKRIDHINYV